MPESSINEMSFVEAMAILLRAHTARSSSGDVISFKRPVVPLEERLVYDQAWRTAFRYFAGAPAGNGPVGKR